MKRSRYLESPDCWRRPGSDERLRRSLKSPRGCLDKDGTRIHAEIAGCEASIQDTMEELEGLDADLPPPLEDRAAASHLMEPDKYTPAQIAEPAKTRAWELVGLYFYHHRRVHEALSILWGLYQQLLKGQKIVGRIHKGTPLVWISDCFGMLGFLVHAKRYLMLTLCEDAL